jgi:hypothetical protein
MTLPTDDAAYTQARELRFLKRFVLIPAILLVFGMVQLLTMTATPTQSSPTLFDRRLFWKHHHCSDGCAEICSEFACEDEDEYNACGCE